MQKLIVTLALLCGLALLATQTPLAASPPPAPEPSLRWQATSAMAAEAEAAGEYDAALAWLSEEGPVRAPLAEVDDVAALRTLCQAWAARGDQRIEQGEVDAGLTDLAAVLQHGAAVERHAQTIHARSIGAEIQTLSLDLLALTPLKDLSGAQRAELLMVLGEAAVIPSPEETLDRQCSDSPTAETWWQREAPAACGEHIESLATLLEENAAARASLREVLR